MESGYQRAWSIAALSVVLAWCTCGEALNPSLDISQYAHNAWKRSEGFGPGGVQQIAQSPDGYLWLATESGLFRFDGVRAVKWQPPPGQHLPTNNIVGLMAARDGTVWLGTPKGLASWKEGKLTSYAELDGYDVYPIFQDYEGTVWAGGVRWEHAFSEPGKLCAIKPGRVQCWGDDGTFGFGVSSIYEDSNSNLWVGAGNGLWRWKPGPPKRYPLPIKELGATVSVVFTRNGIVAGERGGLILAAFRGVIQFVDGKTEPFPFPSSPPELKEATLLRDRDGGLWISSEDAGLMHLHNGRMDVYTEADGLSSNSVLSMFEDREGNIWVATSNGMDRFREYAIPSIGRKQGLSSPFVECVLAARDGSLWLGTSDGLNRWKDGQITIYRKATEPQAKNAIADTANRQHAGGASVTNRSGLPVREIRSNGLPDNFVLSLFQDFRGRIWITTFGGLSYYEDGRLNRFTGLPFPPQNPVVRDSKGYLWSAQSDRGLVRMDEWKLVEQIPWNNVGVPGSLSNPLVADAINGGIWVGSWGGGVAYFKDGRVRASYGPRDGLGEGRVNSLQFDSDGALWAATDGGLSRIKSGHATTLTSQNGLPCDTVHDVLEDNDHTVWVKTACGLARIERAEINAWVDDSKRAIKISVFDSSDGVTSKPGVYNFGPRVARTADGKLWISPIEGIMVVDPHHLARNNLPPPVHIEQITADGKTYTPPRNGRAEFPPRVRDLAIDFTALSFAAPEKVRFRYLLEGQDTNWREGSDRHVEYSNLAPRHYQFRVIACNNSGVWNEQGDALEFSVAPAYYQTNWFFALCAVCLLALLWGLHRLRVRQVAREFAMRLDERVNERTRIARDLHDTLLQGAHGLLVQLEVVSQLLMDRPAEAKQVLDRTIERAAEAITEGRDAVQGLRESVVQRNDLARAVNALGEELATDSGNGGTPTFRVTVEGEPRDLHPLLRDEIFRIGAEALRNAFRHAQARHIEVAIRYDDEQIRLCIRDDGKGMDPGVLAGRGTKGHYGLPGMQERATLIGGKLTVWSEVDAGTELELCVPAGTAYTTTRKSSWISRT